MTELPTTHVLHDLLLPQERQYIEKNMVAVMPENLTMTPELWGKIIQERDRRIAAGAVWPKTFLTADEVLAVLNRANDIS